LQETGHVDYLTPIFFLHCPSFELVVNLPHDPLNQIHRCGDLSQQSFHNAEPFRIEWFSAYRLSRPTVPIGRVALIAFFAMQVGVHPRTIGAFVLLGGFVRSRPVAFAIRPQSSEGECESGWRFGCGERLAKIVQGHLGCSRDVTVVLILAPLPNFRIIGFGWITNDSNPIQYPALLNTEGQQWQI
jgi:hypothetical protein